MVTPYVQRSEWGISQNPPVEYYGISKITNDQNIIFNDTFTSEIDRRHSYDQENREQNVLGRRCAPFLPSLCGVLLGVLTAGLILAIVIAMWVTSPNNTSTIVASTTVTDTSITSTNSSTSSTSTTSTISTTSSTSTTSTISTTSSTSTTSTISTTSTTSTTTPAFCANTCTGNLTTNTNITTCGLVCVDIGGYLCQSSSTYCASGGFASGGYCSGVACPAGYCCVYDTYASSNPFLCISCFTG